MLARSSFNAAARTAMIQRQAIRAVATTSISVDESQALLAAQRRRRPNSPHLTIYQPQLTWYLSMFNRITGVALSGGMSYDC
jgi:succinate dehydrogenase (ubiquinone) cytochrome b560 subunit